LLAGDYAAVVKTVLATLNPDNLGIMKIHNLKREQWLSQPLESIYPFFERPENLALITPDSLDFKLLTPSPVPMEQGRVIDYTIRFKMLPIRWRSIISTYKPPYCFVDEQLKGPYSFWHHTHEFKSEKGGTRLFDEVRYALPLYIPETLSNWLHRVFVRPELERIFDFRQNQFERLFNTDDTRQDNQVVSMFKEN
jgi:ligand-binding SRPBCC domain-containing protein